MLKKVDNIILSINSTIRDALEIINLGGLKIALLLDEDNKLEAIVTDGDIRRGLLSGKSLDSNIREVANRNPLTAEASTSRKQIKQLMHEHEIVAIPILEEGRLLGIETLASRSQLEEKENAVFIMAGGFGSRLRPLTDNCPKPMLNIGKKPILERVISRFKNHGFKRFYISVHYLPEVITSYFGDGAEMGIQIEYIHEKLPLGTGGALGLVNHSNEQLPMIVINGDILTNADFSKILSFHENNGVDITSCVREYEHQIPFGVVETDNNLISAITEKPTYKYFVNTGIYVINTNILNAIKKNYYIDMPTLLQEQIALGRRVAKFQIRDYWIDIGQKHDFERAQLDYKKF